MPIGPSGRPARNCSITGTFEVVIISFDPKPTNLDRNSNPK
jgi:hypothetical protein